MRIPEKKELFESQVIIVSAQQGAGKSSLVASICNNIYNYGKAHYLDTNAHILYLNKRLGYKLNRAPQSHYIYSTKNFRITLGKKMESCTYDLDPERIGVPDGTDKYQYFPFGSYLIIDEADSYYPCREWRKTTQNFIDFLKYNRHNNLTIILICQVVDNLELKIRQLATKQFVVLSSVFAPKKFLFWTIGFNSKFQFLLLENQKNAQYENLKALGYKVKPPAIRICKYRYKGDIRTKYNHRAGEALFLYGADKNNYEYTVSASQDLSPESVRAFVEPFIPRPKDKPS